jgi:protein O-mannosyl-transferase
MFVKTLQAVIERNPVIWSAAFLFLFSVAIYSGMLQHEFVWDDESAFVDNHRVKELNDIPSFFSEPLVFGSVSKEKGKEDDKSKGSIRYYRPFLSTLHLFESHVFGVNPLGYKIVNLLFNGVVVVCAFLLVRAITDDLPIAFLSSFLYAANPARGEVVYWAYSDSHVFAALFSLLALLAYHRRRTLLALALLGMGLLFQEGVILAVGVLFVYEFTISTETGGRWRRFVPFAVLAGLYLVVRHVVAGAVPVADLDFLYRLRAAAYLIVKYLQVVFVTDAPVTMYLYVPGMFASGGVATPVFVVAAVLFLSAGVWLWWRCRRWFFWYSWFILWLALSINVGGYADYLMAEKSLYLAALGPCVLLVALVCKAGRYRPAGLALLVLLVCYQGWATVSRGRYWGDTITYLEKLLEFEPAYDVARYQLGVEYDRKQRYADALSQFEVLLKLQPGARHRIVALQTDVYDRWGRALAERGDLQGALDAFEQAKGLSPGRSNTFNSLGNLHFMRGDHRQAKVHWETALRLDYGNSEARSNLERLARQNGEAR